MNNMMKRIITVLVILAGLLTACDYFILQNNQTEVIKPSPVPNVLPISTAEAGDYFRIFFTNPESKINTNGIETNLIYLIEYAKSSIDAAVYDIDLTNVINALIAAHKRGVTVRIVYDNGNTPKESINKLNAGGITETIPDKRTAFMHNKFFVIDNSVVWTGSFNITNSAAYKNNENAVIFNVPELAENYEAEFNEMFNNKFGPDSPANTPHVTTSFDKVVIENYFAPEDHVREKVDAIIKNAKYTINFLVYSFTDVGLAQSMLKRTDDDVVVKGVFDKSQATGYSVCSLLLTKQNVTVKLDSNPAIMHEKVIIIDNEIVIFGSYNFSQNADTQNDENLLIVHDPQFGAFFEKEFQKIFDKGITPQAGCKLN
jgi:phosphatidylserine/phosphatidylglycerophosphate/cardiolipin synthase-like enzyme